MKLTINVPLLPGTPAPYKFEASDISESQNDLNIEVVGWDDPVIKQLADMTLHAMQFQHTVYKGTLELGDTVYNGVFIKEFVPNVEKNTIDCVFQFDYKFNAKVTGSSVNQPFIVNQPLITGKVS